MPTNWRIMSRSRILAMMAVFVVGFTSFIGTAGAATNAPLVVGDIWPYSGALAEYGLKSQAGCLAAAYVIKKAGGVLGHQITCAEVDDKGDSVDAVPVVEKFLSTTHDLIGVSGPETTTSLALAPLLDRAKVPWVSYTGSSYFNHQTSPYFFRMALVDAVYGATLAYITHLDHYKRVAVILGANSGAADLHGGVLEALRKLGSPKLVLTLSLAVDQPSYSTEVARVASAHPTAIIAELDPQTITTFFSNLKSEYHLIPFVTDATDLTIHVFDDLSKTVGKANVLKYLHAASSTVSVSGPGAAAYKSALNGIKNAYPSAPQDFSTPQAQYTYTTVVYFALAMLEAHSTNPKVFTPYIKKVTNPGPGKVTVKTYTEAAKDIAAGKRIHYLGLLGPVNFDKYGTSTPPLDEYKYKSNGAYGPSKSLPATTIQALVS